MHLLMSKKDTSPGPMLLPQTAAELAGLIPRTGRCPGCGYKGCARKAESPGYTMAELRPGGRRRLADTVGTEWLALDIDRPDLPAELEPYERVEIRTHSGNWHVLVRLERRATPDEYSATARPWVARGADAKALDACRFLFAPHRDAVVRAREGVALAVRMAEAAPVREKPKAAPRVGSVPGLEAWTRESLLAVLRAPADTNAKAGHLGAMLAQHHWSEDDAKAYVTGALADAGQGARHVESALSAFRKVRNGDIAWNGMRRLQEQGLLLLGASAIEEARPLMLRYNDSDQARPWWRWTGAVWLATSEAEAEALCHVLRPELNALNGGQRNAARSNMLRDHRRYTMPATNTDDELLNCPNGVVNLRTGALEPHAAGYYCTRVAGVPYDPTLDTASVEAVMLDWCDGDRALADYVWSLMGTAALGTGKKFFAIITGPTNTGKSCITALLGAALGSYTAHVDGQAWLRGCSESERQEQMSQTDGARLVESADIDEHAKWHNGIVKRFVSGGKDVMPTAGKWKRTKDIVPKALLWITCNDVPTGADVALRGRALVVPLTRQFPKNAHFAGTVLPTLTAAALVRIVAEAGRALERGGPLPPPERAQTTAAEALADPFALWLDDLVTETGSLTARELWSKWSTEKPRDAHPQTETALGRRLLDPDLAKKYPRRKTKNANLYSGFATETKE